MTDRERGTLESVDEVPEGSSVLVDTAIAALLVPLQNDGDFRDEGGLAWIADASYVYTGITDDKELELDASNPLVVAVEAGDPVLALTSLGYPEARWAARVRVDPTDEEPVTAYIDTTDRAYFRLGDVDAGALVEVESLGTNRYRVASRLYDPASFDAGHLDPGSIPDPVPVDPPATSPAVTLTGIPAAIIAHSETVAASVLIQYHVWDATVGDATYVPTVDDPATLYEIPTRSAVQIIDHMPSGAPLAEDTDYYVATYATNAAGPAVGGPSAVATGRVDMSAIRELVLGELVAGNIFTGRIDIGASSWDADNGLVFRDALGNPFITLPADGTATADIYAFIRAAGITVEDNANFYGLAQLFGTLKLTNGTPDPAVQAQMARTWNRIETDLGNGTTFDPAWGPIWRGMAPKIGSSAAFITAVSFFGGTVREIDLTTGVHNAFVFPNLGDYWVDGGICTIGSFYYMLGRDYTSGRNGDWWVRKYNSSFVLQAEWFFISASGMTKRPAIGTDGTNILVARNTPAGNLRLTEQTTAGAGVQDVQLIGGGQSYDIGGVFRGAADFPAAAVRLVVQPVQGSVLAFNTSHARQTAHEWERAGGAQVLGIMWDGTRFKTVDATGDVWDLADGHPISETWYGGYAWVDEDTSSGSVRHETKVSPAKSFLWPGRSRLVVTGQPAPDVAVTDPSKRDKANLVRVYAGSAAAAMRLQAGGGTNSCLPLGVTSLSLENPDTGSAIGLTTSTFIGVAGAPGSVESALLASDAAPVAQIKGDATGRLLKQFQAGEVATGTLVVNTDASQNITFLHPFDAPPQVTGFCSFDPATRFVWATNVTATGFTLNYRRTTGTGTFAARWIAMASTQ